MALSSHHDLCLFLHNSCSFWPILDSGEYNWFYAVKCQGLCTHWVKAVVTLNSTWHRDCLLPVCLMHTSGVLVLFTSVLLNCCITLWNGSASDTCCTSYQMLGTVSAYVFHHSTGSSLFLNIFSALWVAACPISWLAYPFVCGQRLLCFSIGTLIFSITEQFFLKAQAFASPTDMASSLTLDEAMSVGLAKGCALRKNCSVIEKISVHIE